MEKTKIPIHENITPPLKRIFPICISRIKVIDICLTYESLLKFKLEEGNINL